MRRAIVPIFVFTLCGAAMAETITVGAALAPRTLEDQHGKPHELDASVRRVVFTRDMDAGDQVKEALETTSGEELAERGIAYLADISGMPRLVARLFALPAMRRRAYAMWLDRDGKATADLPSEPGKVTVLHLQGLLVEEIAFVESAQEVRDALGLGQTPRAD